jgi:hypothetical protein
MIVGHYAPALIAYQRAPRGPLWLYLLAAGWQDLLWLGLAIAGLEVPQPGSPLEATFQNLRVEMTYSHDLLPTLWWAAVFALLGLIIARNRRAAFWCGALVIIHTLTDLVTGFPHHVFGPDSATVGLNLYGRLPELSIVAEAVFGAACVGWFSRARARAGRPLFPGTALGLYAVFVLGALAWLPTARVPLGQLLRLR